MTNSRLTNLRIHTKPNIMKKIVLLVILALGFFDFGCNRSYKSEKDTPECYVWYTVGLDTRYMGVALDIVYVDEYNETITLSTDKAFSIVLGPVERGFTAFLSAGKLGEIGNTTLKANIAVTKNDGPFTVKASGENDTSEPLKLEYTIDF